MNEIIKRQNEPASLQLLAAQRWLYSRAKRMLGWQLILVGPVATLAAVLGIVLQPAKPHLALFGLSVLVLDVLWLTPTQKRLRDSAARVQEQFDCHVLGLKWDAIRCGNPEPAESIREQAMLYEGRAAGMTPLTDWYPQAVDRLPLVLARIVCQRSNCWWDAKQRRGYAATMASLLLAAFLGVLLAGVITKLPVDNLLLLVVLPMSATLKLGYQQWTEHREAADRLDRLRERLERTWKDALLDPTSPATQADSQSLQAQIYEARKRNPLVFDFIFRRLRDQNEALMNHGAQELVAQAEDLKPASTA